MKYSVKLNISLLCCSLLVSAACGGASPTNGTDTALTNPTTTAAVTAGANPREELDRAIKAQLNARSFRMRMVPAPGSGGAARVTIESEYVNPDRSRFRMGPMEMVMIGGDIYTKMPGAAWTKSGDASDPDEAARFSNQVLADSLKHLRDVTFVGTDALEGSPMRVYRYVFDDPNVGRTTSKIWIGASDDLPRKVESETEVAGEPKKMEVVMTFYDYNADIKIEPPM